MRYILLLLSYLTYFYLSTFLGLVVLRMFYALVRFYDIIQTNFITKLGNEFRKKCANSAQCGENTVSCLTCERSLSYPSVYSLHTLNKYLTLSIWPKQKRI